MGACESGPLESGNPVMLSRARVVAGTQAESWQYSGVRWAHSLSGREKRLNKEKVKERDRMDQEEAG